VGAAIAGCGGEGVDPNETIDDLAAYLARASETTWTGPRVDPPAEVPRPEIPLAVRSEIAPLAIHADPAVPADVLDRALAALEDAYVTMNAAGWPTPVPDGGYGGTGELDLYLMAPPRHGATSDGQSAPLAGAATDALVAWSYLDAASTFAWVDPDVDAAALPACVASAYAQTVLLGQDPAEAEAWRRATSDWLAWQITGRYGCDDGVITAQQQEAWRSPIEGAAGRGGGGALFLTWLSDRHDRGRGIFIRDLWALARQRTWEGAGLRASPDLWEAIEVAVELSADEFDAAYEDFAVARWFTGAAEREAHSPVSILNDLPPDGMVPHAEAPLPGPRGHRTGAFEPFLEPLGSGYALYDVADASDGTTLRVWLRGEYGVRWSFVAVKLDVDGKELGRITAPPRERHPNGFLEVDLTDTDRVLVVVTNLSSRRPDADLPDENVRTFELITDTYRPAEVEPEGPTLAPR
jgi:hypothetical protein